MNPRSPSLVVALLAIPPLAADVSLSGTVTDPSGNILPGAGISLAGTGHATSTGAGGEWSLSSVTGIVVRSKSSAVLAANPLVLDGKRLRLRFDGVDAAGRASDASSRSFHGSPPRTASDVPANRSADVFVDTLLFSWNGRVRARVGIASLAAGGVGVQAIDTSSTGEDVPWSSGIAYGSLTDSRDGQFYRTVSIGTRRWMAQNLNYAGDLASLGVCYNGSADSCWKFGRLYTWAEAMALAGTYDSAMWGSTATRRGICPGGWHVPSDSEWTAMLDSVEADSRVGSGMGGTALKSRSGWRNSGGGTDVFGFRVLPAGERFHDGTNRYAGYNAYFWSSSEYDANDAWYRYLFEGNANAYRGSYYKPNGFSLRCLED